MLLAAVFLYGSKENAVLIWNLMTHPMSVKIILYMAAVLAVGLPFIYSITDVKNPKSYFYKLPNLTIRKLFHFLAFFCFTPAHLYMVESKEVFRLLVFAFNCVTVLFIFIELVRYSNQGSAVGDYLNACFIKFADSREQMNQLMLTHLYLMMGCSIPTCITFIILDGGFMNGELAVFAYSGVLFLGVGDSVAALYGKLAG